MSSHGENDRKNIRFSDTEKRVLHFLFKEYEDIIDIKQRRNNKNYKMSEVRECWQTILNKFNLHHGTTERNLKQIQKFWLNSRLRMRNSSIDSGGGNSFKVKGRKKKSGEKESQTQYNDGHNQSYNAKSKVEHSESPNSNNSQSDEDDDDEDSYENEREIHKERTLKQEMLDSKYEDNNDDEDIDEIDETNNESALRQQDERLHLPRSRKSLQNIRSNTSECSDQSASYNRQNISNDNIEELQTFQNLNQPNATIASGYLINTLNQSNPIMREQQQRPNEISHSEHHQNHLTQHSQHILNQQQYETQINILKIQEYENKIKEQQLKCEQQKIAILKSQEELEHFKEMNRLKIREMQLKIFLLEEQTKLRRNKM